MFLPAAPRPNYFLTPAIKGSEPAVELLEPAAYNRKTSPARPARVIKTARVGVQTSLSSSSPISFLSFALQSPRHFALCPRFLRRCSSTPFRVFSFSFFFFRARLCFVASRSFVGFWIKRRYVLFPRACFRILACERIVLSRTR